MQKMRHVYKDKSVTFKLKNMTKELEVLHEKNTLDFKTMKSMLDDIQISLMQLQPLDQIEFYQPIQYLIFNKWQEIGGHKQETLNEIILGK